MELIERLKTIISQVALSRGEVTLAAGSTSDRYVNMRKVTLHPTGAILVGTILRTMTNDKGIVAIGGPATAAIPMITAAVMSYALTGRHVHGFYVRQQAKDHGLRRLIEGYELRPGDRVAMVEDVTTSGTSLLDAVLTARAAGAVVEDAISIVDRPPQGQAGARGLDWGVTRFRSIMMIDDLDWSKV